MLLRRSTMKKDRVVVVGGGIAGAMVAKLLQNASDVVLIDPKEYFEIPWANLRAKVEPGIAEKSIIQHTDYLMQGRIITSFAVDVKEGEVLTAVGRVVSYDYLVIATGHVTACPRKRIDRIEMFQEENEKIKNSTSILIIGGGPVGVELAAEIAMDYPKKRIILVHSGPRLVEFISPRASALAADWLRSKKNVRVLLNQSMDLENITESDRVYKTSAGETVIADTFFDCTGKQIGSEWLENSILKEYINENGRLMVDESLRVGGLKNIFAIGDITDTKEPKQGEVAQKHATLVAKNLKTLIKHGPDSKEHKLLKYKHSTSASAMVTLGRRDALADFPFMTISGLIPGMVRSRDLFVGRTRKLMGLDIFNSLST